MPRIYLLCLFFALPFIADAQDENLRYEDYIYQDQIKSVLFHRSDSVLSYPIVSLNGFNRLRLSFDDMDADIKDYLYTIVHCDANWQPSDIDELEYLDGFMENNITEFQFSYNTIRDYTHFQLDLPNEDIRWTKSGNYLLKVYNDEDERTLAITRRFVVTERLMNISGRFVRPSNPEVSSTHQELDFTVSHPNVRVSNPQDEIRAVILQNGRWDNAIFDVRPKFIRNEKLVYDHQGKILFPGGKEFRHLDMRSFDFRTDRIEEIEEYEDHYKLFLHTEKPRPYRPYIYFLDLNGRYVVENLDVSLQFGRTAQMDIAQSFNNTDSQAEEHARQGDYAWAYFSLRAPIPYEGKKVYLFGAFTGWEIKPEYELTYHPETNNYEGEALLKQGYYNYTYALVPDANPKEVDFSEIEGDWHETENDYVVLIYWKPFGQRYTRAVSMKVFNSVRGQ